MFPASPPKNRIILAFACVYLCWGSTYGAIHIAGLHLAPPLVGAMRSILSTVLLVVICLKRGTSLRVSRGTAWRLALVGILLMTVNNLMLIWGETKVASGLASLFIAAIPIFVAVMEAALPGGETLNWRGVAGTLLGVIGIGVLLWPAIHRADSAIADGGAADHSSVMGFAILIVAALAFATGSVLSRRFHFKVDTLVATTWQVGAAGVVNLTLAAGGGNFRTAHWTMTGLLAITFLSIIGTVVGLSAYTYLLQHVPVTKVSTYALVNPAVAVVIGAILFHERIDLPELAGMMLILCAVATVILSRVRPTALPNGTLPEPLIEE
jgi:drug/metabolite transporter (DMT)-like permease